MVEYSRTKQLLSIFDDPETTQLRDVFLNTLIAESFSSGLFEKTLSLYLSRDEIETLHEEGFFEKKVARKRKVIEKKKTIQPNLFEDEEETKVDNTVDQNQKLYTL